jgi:hypothetical protein
MPSHTIANGPMPSPSLLSSKRGACPKELAERVASTIDLPGRTSKGPIAKRSPLSGPLQKLATASTSADAPPVGIIPGLPNEMAAAILSRIEVPKQEFGTQLRKLMQVNRSWLAEVNRQTTWNPAFRDPCVDALRDWCDKDVRRIVDDVSLSPEDVRREVAESLSKTGNVKMDIGPPGDFGDLEKRLNRRIALDVLATQTELSSLHLRAASFDASEAPKELIFAITTVLSNSPTLEEVKLNLTDAGLSGADVASLLKALVGKPISTLFLNRNGLDAEGINAIGRLLPQIDMGTLLLSKSELGDEGAKVIASAIPKSLRSLTLKNNGIGNAGIASLIAALPSSELERLYLQDNACDDEFKSTLSSREHLNALGKPVEVHV